MAPSSCEGEPNGQALVGALDGGVGADGADEFESTFRALLPSVRSVAWRLLGDEALAEDVAAEAFVRTLVRWKRVQDLPHRDAWILRVATNLALDQLRRRRRDQALADRVVVGPSPEVDPTLRVDVVRALAALPKRQREVLVLRHLAGLPEVEVAQAMGVTVNTVKTHAARGLAGLRAGSLAELTGGTDAH